MALVDVTVSKTLSWGYEECVLRTFRVQGTCEVPDQDCPLPCAVSDTQQYVVNVTACTVEDVCKKLRESGFLRTIKSVEVFNAPLLSGDPNIIPVQPLLDDTLGPNCLTDVTPTVDGCVECCDFLIDENVLVRLGVHGFYTALFQSGLSGGMVVSSQTVSAWNVPYRGSGRMAVSGQTEAAAAQYITPGRGGMAVAGRFGVLSSHYEYAASGGMVVASASGVGVSRYLYASQGELNINGRAACGSGFGYPASGGMRVAGGAAVAARDFYLPALAVGGMRIDGGTRYTSSRYVHRAGGAVVVSGFVSTGVSFYRYVGSGSMVMRSLAGVGFGYRGGATMTVSGLVVPRWGTSLSGRGLVRLGSSFRALSPGYTYVGSGGMVVSGSTFVQCSHLGTIDDAAGVTSSIEEASLAFVAEAATALVPLIGNVALPSCCSSVIPTLLELQHNLFGVQALNNFLLRNGLALQGDSSGGTFVSLQYRPRLGVWQSNVHLAGLSVANDGDEAWDFDFEFGCTDESGGSFLGKNVWKFSLFMRRRESSPDQDFMLRLLALWDLATVCPAGRPFDGFDFSFDFKNRATTPAAAVSPIFHDEAALLETSPSFSNQEMKFKISVANKDRRQTLESSLSQQSTAASQVADSSGHPI